MPLGNDGACPYFVPVGERYALFNFSHESGPHVFIGDYDKVTHRFTPDRLQKLNFGPLGNSSYQAPCALADGEGGVYLVLNTKDGDRTLERDGAMSLVYRMTLGEDGLPRYRPVEAIQSLRKECREMEPQILPAFEEKMLDVRGRAMDIELQLRRRSAHSVRLRLLRSDDGREHTDILLHMPGKRRPNIAYLTVDLTEASLSPTVQGRVPASTQFDLADDEPLNMRILLDRCMLEVFVNDRVVLMQMMYPTLADSDGVSIQALGGEMELTSAKFWQMGSIYESSNITEVP
jgi:beta-fructofuranosidase